jgi:hypothetical protein
MIIYFFTLASLLFVVGIGNAMYENWFQVVICFVISIACAGVGIYELLELKHKQ